MLPFHTSMHGLVKQLAQEGAVRTQRVAHMLGQVDRAAFVDPAHTHHHMAYEDRPLPIGSGQTISAPHMHAVALELLEQKLQPGARVLDVGSGSGYLTACMGLMVSPGGFVLGVEKEPALASMGARNVAKAQPELVRSGTVRIVHGNVLSDMLEQEDPFDAIHVGAAAEELPRELVDKMKPEARMVIPLGPYGDQALMVVDKDRDGHVHVRPLMGVMYVPLTRPGE